MARRPDDPRMQTSNARTAAADERPAEEVKGRDEMSASTRTIQQPIGKGSIFGAVAMVAAVIIAALAITWGAANLTATRTVVTQVPVPVLLDKGSRDELAPAAVGGTTPRSVLDLNHRFELQEQAPLSPGGFGGTRQGSTTSNGGHGGRLAQ
jgi:hypothetical protein